MIKNIQGDTKYINKTELTRAAPYIRSSTTTKYNDTNVIPTISWSTERE